MLVSFISGEEDDQEEILKGICGDSKKLKTFPCDPFDYHTILDALQGCSGLFYCFQPPQDHPTYDVSLLFHFLLIASESEINYWNSMCVTEWAYEKHGWEWDVIVIVL